MKTLFCYFNVVMLFVFLAFTNTSFAQNDSNTGIKYIQKLIDNDSLVKAKLELNSQTEKFKAQKNYDTLAHYIYYYGKIELIKEKENVIAVCESKLKELKTKTTNSIALYNAYFDIALLASEANENQKSYNYYQLSYSEALKTKNNLNKLAQCQYGMAGESYRMRKMDLVKKHGINAYNLNNKNPKSTPKNKYNSGNILGLVMQNENKLDSALVYYNWALDALKTTTEKDFKIRYNYPAVLNANISIVLMNQGKFSESIKTQQEAMRFYMIYLDSAKAKSGPEISNAKYNLLSNINNMGSNYVKLGQIERANQLFEYNYEKAKDFFPENSIQQIIFARQFAQAKWTSEDLQEALDIINETEEKFKKLDGNYAGFMAYSLSIKASILENFGRTDDAYEAYKYADEVYNQSSPGMYSFDRLTNLRAAATFYSRNNFTKEAIETSNKVLQVVEETSIYGSLESIKALSLQSEIYYNLKNYEESITWANKSLKELGKKPKTTDSIYWISLKLIPNLFKAKSNFRLIDNTDSISVLKIYKNLKTTIDILNTSSSSLSSNTDKNNFLFNNKAITDFTMKIAMQLYTITKNESYLEHVISMHESTIYNRIRSKLNIREDMKFSNVPQKIIEREKTLKENLETVFNENNVTQKTIQEFNLANTEWKIFLDSLQQNNPKYYQLRYKTIKESLGDIQSNIPENTTVVRYLFIDDDLYAFIVDKTQKEIFKLNFNTVKDYINQLAENQSEVSTVSSKLHKLYQQLWQPFENEIKTENIIIIPDGELFNLSFETLTPTKINSFKDLATNSLLAKYSISYNYSLLLLDKNRKTVDYSNDFIAFAPEFSDKMKDDYRIAITDSLSLDKTYLNLLPQPFSVDLAKEFSELFKGKSFLNQNASKQIFINEANEHKIIHIGTHAESNNVSPELSRLIFAKNASDDDNSLYTYEIYNQNLNSNLAILTACETGKPTYQSGEGMISLAHAFNYAGSESILTSLWKIDEQSSTQIINLFYKNISKGLTKDKALQQAKLDYISSAQGRTVSPQYWAGLVLIGDASPIDISTSSNNLLFWIFGVLAIILIAVFFRKKRNA